MKKRSAIWAFVPLLSLLLTACGGDSYPELELPDVSALETVHAVCEDVRFDYPDGKWTLAGQDPAQLYLTQTLEDSASVAVTVRFEAASTKLTESDLRDLKKEMLSADMDFMEAAAAEFRSVDGERVAYLDIVVSDMDRYLDAILEAAGLTEADLADMGGRDALLESMPATSQLMFYFNRGADLYSVSGVYFNEDQKNALLELFAVIYPSLGKA